MYRAGHPRAKLRLNRIEKLIRRRQTMCANQWHELLCRDQERDGINEADEPQNNEAGEPIGVAKRRQSLEHRFPIHRRPRKRPTPKAERPISNWEAARGENRTPDQPRKLSGLLYFCK